MSGINKHISLKVSVFHGRKAPEEALLVGYGALIEAFRLPVPFPAKLALISSKKRQYETAEWQEFTSRHQPEDNLYKHLVFALKYEGIDLLVFKKLFEVLTQNEVEKLVTFEKLGQYSRRIWFLYEWLMGTYLSVPDLRSGNSVPLLNEDHQFAVKGISSPRHRIINNLPGTVDFCPLIFKTGKLKSLTENKGLQEQKNAFLKSVHKDVLQRASLFLLLRDSKASFTIEGENPGNSRAIRWGKAIAQAGTQPLSKGELVRLQQIVIENSRFVEMGFRKRGGFVGEHDRISGEPIPDHISAKWQNIDRLMDGLLLTNDLLEEDFDAVLAAAVIAFGFVFIHPFEDGNGRLHRYIVHHVLARKNFSRKDMVFPVSASILDHIDTYRRVLESYSHPLLDHIRWKETPDHNIEVLNETIDYYRYFDATPQAEFLYDCVVDTIQRIVPEEIDYLVRYDEFKRFLDNHFEMPDKMVASLIRFLLQNKGKLSARARKKELGSLSEDEVMQIEEVFKEVFNLAQ